MDTCKVIKLAMLNVQLVKLLPTYSGGQQYQCSGTAQ